MASPRMQALIDAVEARGVRNDPRAVYDLAQQMGVLGSEVDRAFDLGRGTSDAWAQQQGLGALQRNDWVPDGGWGSALTQGGGTGTGGTGGTAGAGTAGTGGANPRTQSLMDAVNARGLRNDPRGVYDLAKQMGFQGAEVDQAFGLGSGTSDAWARQQGLESLSSHRGQGGGQQSNPRAGGGGWQGGGTQGAGGGQQGGGGQAGQNPRLRYLFDEVNARGLRNDPQGVYDLAQQMGFSGSDVDQAFGLGAGTSDAWGKQQGLQPLQGGGGGQGGNQYLPQGFAPPWDNANPNTQWMAGQMAQGVTDNLQRNLLPGIRSGASLAGGLGGSRQGIAEGVAIGDAAKGLSTSLAGLYGGQYNQDRNYGLANDAMDLSAYNANQNWMRQGQQDQIGLAGTMLDWNQRYGVGNATQIQNAPMDYWNQFSAGANQLGRNGGTQSTNLQGNPWLSGLGGALGAGNLYNNWNGTQKKTGP